jgi:hypothetical protein
MFHFGIGRRGMGKTTLCYRMTMKIERRLIFDPRGMIRANPDAVIVTTRDEMKRAVREVQGGEYAEMIFTPSGDLDEGFDAFAYELRRWIVRTPELPVAVLIDEASFIDQRSKHFQWVVRCSPVETFHILMTCHRPLDLDTTVRAIADHWLIFQCRQEHDLKVIRERCSPEVADAVTRLAPRHFVHWNDGRAVMTVNRFGGTGGPNDWFVPLRARIETRPTIPADLSEPGEPDQKLGRLPPVAPDEPDDE